MSEQATPVDIRAAILERLEEMGRTPYWLSRQVRGCTAKSVQRYLYHRDPTRRREMKLGAIEEVLGILGLEVTALMPPATHATVTR